MENRKTEMLKNKQLSRLGVLLYIDDFKEFVSKLDGICCDNLYDADIIVMSDKYYKKFKRGNFKPNTILFDLGELVSENPKVKVINETCFLQELGIDIPHDEFSDSKNQKVRSGKGNNSYDILSDYTVIDIETTDKNVNDCEIIEVAAVRVRNNVVIDTFQSLVQPVHKVSVLIEKLTGITNQMLVGAPLCDEVIQKYAEFIGDDIVVGHNIASFDSCILYDYFMDVIGEPFSNNMVDTLHFARKCSIEPDNYKLTTIAEYLGITYDAHRALNDCLANQQCYEKLKPLFGKSVSLFDKAMILSEAFDFSGKKVCLTGEFVSGTRSMIKQKLENKGAKVVNSVSSTTDYVIVGGTGSTQWAYGDYGSKVKKALELQNQGKDIKIIREDMALK